ncbi:MAG: hypothetical protein WD423_10530 [Rhodothermales bacterium]
MIRTDFYVLFDNCSDYHDAIDKAYVLIRKNYDIVQEWFDVQGRKGKAFARHFNGRTKTRIKCKDFKHDGRGVPLGMELDTDLLDGYATRRANGLESRGLVAREDYGPAWPGRGNVLQSSRR